MTYIEIYEAQFGKNENDVAFAADFPVEPWGHAQFGAEDTSEASRQRLLALASDWAVLWPKMRASLEEAVIDYKLGWNLSRYEFFASVSTLTEGSYKSDEADIFIRINYDAVPVFDFFIRGSHLAHFQPVF